MTALELQYLVFELLDERLRAGTDESTAVVGIQGDAVVVMQPGGEHFGIRIVPAKATVPA